MSGGSEEFAQYIFNYKSIPTSLIAQLILRFDLLLLLLVTSKLSQFNAGHTSFICAEVWIAHTK